ncbi:unnamed protein product, partial [Brassica oleracea]
WFLRERVETRPCLQVPVGLYLNKAQHVGEEASAVADLLSLGPWFPHSLILMS